MKKLAAAALVLLALLGAGAVYLYLQGQKAQKALGDCQERVAELQGKGAEGEAASSQMKAVQEKLVSDLKEQVQRQEVTLKEFREGLALTFVDRLLFDFGKETLTPQGVEVLKKVGGALTGIQGKRLRVIGHTDPVPIREEARGKFPTNWELSAARAATVVRFLEERGGIPPGEMEAVGRSFHQPVAGNETAEGRAANRRVEILIAPKLEVKGN